MKTTQKLLKTKFRMAQLTQKWYAGIAGRISCHKDPEKTRIYIPLKVTQPNIKKQAFTCRDRHEQLRPFVFSSVAVVHCGPIGQDCYRWMFAKIGPSFYMVYNGSNHLRFTQNMLQTLPHRQYTHSLRNVFFQLISHDKIVIKNFDIQSATIFCYLI